MKIINIKTQLFTLLMLLLTSVGCSDEEFLTEEPKTFYTTDNIFSSETQLDQVILTMYSRLRNFKLTNDQMHGIGSDVLELGFLGPMLTECWRSFLVAFQL